MRRAVLASVLLGGCGSSAGPADAGSQTSDGQIVVDRGGTDGVAGEVGPVDAAQADSSAERDASQGGPRANVTAVEVRGEPGAYTFSVTVESPDIGCAQYADWWEVLDFDGGLIYRRILLHSHVDEQPFTRSGGPVPVAADVQVWVRAHMSTGGYGLGMFGSPGAGFEQRTTPRFRSAEQAPPQPDGCAF